MPRGINYSLMLHLLVAASGLTSSSPLLPASRIMAPPPPHRARALAMAASDTEEKAAAEAAEKQRKKNLLRDAFGINYKDAEEKELARVTKVEQQSPEADSVPEWMKPAPEDESDESWAVRRMMLWLEAEGVQMEQVYLVPQSTGDTGKLALITAKDVPAGATLFEIPDRLILTADAAYADGDVGRDLKILATRQRAASSAPAGDGDGFDTFAIAAELAVERVRSGRLRGRLRRQDGGLQVGLINFSRDGQKGKLLPQWEVEGGKKLQSNRPFSPFIASLPWPDADECFVEPERAAAVEQGSALIGRMIEPAARNAWMKSSQAEGGLAQSTSDEDPTCRAAEALLLAMELTLEPPPLIGEPESARRWGGRVRNGPAICPLVNLVMPSEEIVDAAREQGRINAQLGRPSSGNVDAAIRCVASVDLPAGTLILSDVPGAKGAIRGEIRPKERVTVVSGDRVGQTGMVITFKPGKERTPIVRMDDDQKLVTIPATCLQPLTSPEDGAKAPTPNDGRARAIM